MPTSGLKVTSMPAARGAAAAWTLDAALGGRSRSGERCDEDGSCMNHWLKIATWSEPSPAMRWSLRSAWSEREDADLQPVRVKPRSKPEARAWAGATTHASAAIAKMHAVRPNVRDT